MAMEGSCVEPLMRAPSTAAVCWPGNVLRQVACTAPGGTSQHTGGGTEVVRRCEGAVPL